MARLIVKSPYIKGGAAGGYLKYIGTREGVELLPSGYMEYMAERPRSHGLFGDEACVDMDTVMKELNEYPGNIWTHIISLKREDAERLGYDRAKAWMNLLRTHRNEIAAAMNIPPNDFRWYAAFHDEGDHPHIHMMAWSAKPGQAYLKQEGIRKIKSELTNDIFQHEMQHLYEQKSVSRNELVREARSTMRKLVKQMQNSICDCPEVEDLMQRLVVQIGEVKGKKSYGYLPKKVKPLVDEIVDQMEQLPIIDECYQVWWEFQCQMEDFYSERGRQRPQLSKQKEFRSIKNAVIKEAERIRLGTISFEDRSIQPEDELDEVPLDERNHIVSELEHLADTGDAHAQYLMGKLWRDGPTLIPDSVNARYWFEQAAMQGNVAAQYALAKLLLSGDAEVHNTLEGLHWLETATDNGNHYAAYRLGKEYLRGKIVEKNTNKAMDYFTQSAEAGNQYAQYTLGKLYLEKRDRGQSRYWFTQSAAQGNEYAQFFLDRLDRLKPPSVMLSVTRLLQHMGRVFQNQAPTPSIPGGVQIDRKRLQQLREKKIAMGHKADDHEEQSQDRMMTMG